MLIGCTENHGEYLCGGNNAAAATTEESKEDCAKQCFKTSTCVAWTFDGDTCWTKTTAECKGAFSGWVWGTRECGKPRGNNIVTRVYTYVFDMSLKSVITTTNATTACKSKNAPCKATDTCCDNGRCQVNGADVTGTTEGTCRVSEPFPPLSEYQPGYLP